jgi:hypothetical protein
MDSNEVWIEKFFKYFPLHYLKAACIIAFIYIILSGMFFLGFDFNIGSIIAIIFSFIELVYMLSVNRYLIDVTKSAFINLKIDSLVNCDPYAILVGKLKKERNLFALLILLIIWYFIFYLILFDFSGTQRHILDPQSLIPRNFFDLYDKFFDIIGFVIYLVLFATLIWILINFYLSLRQILKCPLRFDFDSIRCDSGKFTKPLTRLVFNYFICFVIAIYIFISNFLPFTLKIEEMPDINIDLFTLLKVLIASLEESTRNGLSNFDFIIYIILAYAFIVLILFVISILFLFLGLNSLRDFSISFTNLKLDLIQTNYCEKFSEIMNYKLSNNGDGDQDIKKMVYFSMHINVLGKEYDRLKAKSDNNISYIKLITINIVMILGTIVLPLATLLKIAYDLGVPIPSHLI